MNVGMLSIGGVGAAVICMAALDGSDGRAQLFAGRGEM